jgi:hypothetical protein
MEKQFILGERAMKTYKFEFRGNGNLIGFLYLATIGKVTIESNGPTGWLVTLKTRKNTQIERIIRKYELCNWEQVVITGQ